MNVDKEIKNPAIVRLARKAGVKSLSGDAIPAVKGMMIAKLTEIISKADMYRDNRDKHRINQSDITNALQTVGMKKVLGKTSKKVCKQYSTKTGKKNRAKPGMRALREIKFYQNQEGCFSMAMEPFKRMVKTIVLDHNDEGVITTDALRTLQTAIEAYIIELLYYANLIAINGNRTRVTGKDISLVVKIKEF